MHPVIVDFLHHVFNDTPVVMQSLTFIHGSEQMTHQDYAYVVSTIPSHLAATWVALEDIHIDAGPLAYYPGSHTLPKFDWGNGLFFTPQSKYNELDFARYIEKEAQRMNLRREVFVANKGDVFLWHGPRPWWESGARREFHAVDARHSLLLLTGLSVRPAQSQCGADRDRG